LLDKCYACLHPIQPHQLSAEDRIITICPKCGIDLRNVESHEVSPVLLSFQVAADNVIANEGGSFGKHELTVSEWFELAHFFSLLIRRLIVVVTNPHKELSKIFNLTDLSDRPLPPRDRIELLRINERQKLLRGVAILLKRGPDFLQKATQTARATRQSLCPKGVVLPWSLRSIFESLPDNTQERKRRLSVKSYPPKPTPRHLVEKRMRHIMRLVKEQKG
tara:strand:+ start:4634 stop:5293 length:660 start_codon:yes stop_codon:yes gene_type:complete